MSGEIESKLFIRAMELQALVDKTDLGKGGAKMTAEQAGQQMDVLFEASAEEIRRRNREQRRRPRTG